jgi:hypothetical protein
MVYSNIVIPLNYIVDDWIGPDDFITPVMECKVPYLYKRFVDQKFKAFSARLPIVRDELAKLTPHINLDYSQKSLEEIEAWLTPFVDDYAITHLSEFPHVKHGRTRESLRHVTAPFGYIALFEGLTPELRSILSDVYTYYGECLRRVIPTLVWEPCLGRKKDSNACYSGFPGIQDPNSEFRYMQGSLGIFLNFSAIRFLDKGTLFSPAKAYADAVNGAPQSFSL